MADETGKSAMKNGIAEIDHLLTKVEDAHKAGADFERLGFTVTPISIIGAMGIMNRLVLMKPLRPDAANFIELMSVADPARLNAEMATLLAGPEGIRCMVLSGPDADVAQRELEANGYAPGQVHRLSRAWELPDETLQVSFDVLLPMKAPFLFNLCRYRTLEHYLRPAWLDHPNGAQSIVSVHCVSADPADDSAYYETLFGQKAGREADGSLAVAPGGVKLAIHAGADFAKTFGTAAPRSQGFVGYTIKVASLAATESFLAKAKVPFGRTAEGLVLAAENGHGNVIRFVG
jgi:hypothetical protein